MFFLDLAARCANPVHWIFLLDSCKHVGRTQFLAPKELCWKAITPRTRITNTSIINFPIKFVGKVTEARYSKNSLFLFEFFGYLTRMASAAYLCYVMS